MVSVDIDKGGRYTYNVPADFWVKGVDNSKTILETILEKIKFQDKQDLETLLREMADFTEEVANDDDDDNGLCPNRSPVLEFSCEEAEALYGVNLQKVSQGCQKEKFLKHLQVNPDTWKVCFQKYYPWVDLQEHKICALKNENHPDFMACACQIDAEGQVVSRSFCLTKVECLLDEAPIMNEVKNQTCKKAIEYFKESSNSDRDWFVNSRKEDRLRVRAPYHKDSPCYQQQFQGHFDIGQLDYVDHLEGRIEVIISAPEQCVELNTMQDVAEKLNQNPNLYQNDIEAVVVRDQSNKEVVYFRMKDKQPQKQENAIEFDEELEDWAVCSANNKKEITAEMQHRMDQLSSFFLEHIAADVGIWLPGMLFGYSSMVQAQGPVLDFVIKASRVVMVSIGVYNAIIPFLPEQYYLWPSQGSLRLVQAQLFAVSLVIAKILHEKDSPLPEFFLVVALVSLVVDITWWKLTSIVYTEERFFNYKIITNTWYSILFAIDFLKILHFLLKLCLTENHVNDQEKPILKKRKEQRKVAKNEVESPEIAVKLANSKSRSSVPTKKRNNKSKRTPKEEFSIECHFQCIGVINTGYITVNCKSCLNQFHSQCWTKFMEVQKIKNEPELLGKKCLTDSCHGRILEIVWVDRFGLETERKYVYADLDSFENNSKQKGKAKQKDNKLTRSLSDSSGNSDKYEPRIATPTRQKVQLSNSVDSPHHVSLSPSSSIKTVSKSYASMVRSDNNNDANINATSARIVDEILELPCPSYFNQNCKLPEKSKILSLIGKNKESNDDSLVPSSSSSIVFVPGVKKFSSQSQQQQSDKAKNVIKEEREEIANVGTNNKIDFSKTNSSPFTLIMAKRFPDFSVDQIENAIQQVSSSFKLQRLTIPEFQDMVEQKLKDENDEAEIYMSDDDDDSSSESDTEECCICTELLTQDLRSLDPCQHVFHELCIKDWLNKNMTCPKCRADVV